MTILIINATYGIGSTGKIVKTIGDKMKNEGHRVLYGVQRANENNPNIFIIGNTIDWKIHAFLSRVFCLQGFCSSIATFAFLRKLRKEKIDVINFHNVHSNFVNFHSILKYCAKKQIKVVLSLHDSWFFTGKCFHFVDFDCDKYKTGCGKCPKKHFPPVSFFFDSTKHLIKIKNNDYKSISSLSIVSCSEWMLKIAKKSIIGKYHLYLIKNEINCDIFNYRNDTRNSHRIKVLGFANKWRLEVNKEIVARLLNSEFDFTIVGCTKSDSDYFRALSPRVVLIGRINSEKEMSDIYRSNDVFVNLTRADTYATVNMESICCGTPVVCFDVCSNSEMVNSKTGLLISPNNADNILDLVKEASLLDKKECAAEGRMMFSKNDFANEYCSLFNSLEETSH